MNNHILISNRKIRARRNSCFKNPVIITAFSLLFFLFSCSHRDETVFHRSTLIVGTFNIGWLGDGFNDRIERSEDDYMLIAEVIAKSEIDLLGVQEIENEAAIKKVIKYLPGHKYIIGSGGKQQNVGIIYKSELSIKPLGNYYPLAVEPNNTRPGLLAEVKCGNFDFDLMVVHLKSTSHYDDTGEKKIRSYTIREKQAEAISDWIHRTLSEGKEQDLLIIGDFNDSPLRSKNNTLYPLLDDNDILFLTDSLKSCKFQSWYVIDQIIATKSAANRLIRNSSQVFDQYSVYPKEKALRISDHCPVSVVFDLSPADND